MEVAKQANSKEFTENIKNLDTKLEQLKSELNKYGTNIEDQTKYFNAFDIREKESEYIRIQSTINESKAKAAAVLFNLNSRLRET